MKIFFSKTVFVACSLISFQLSAQPGNTDTSINTTGTKNLYMDVRRFEPGKVKFEAVAEAHKKDLAVQDKYGTNFMKFWVDEDKGLVYCLVSSGDTESIRKSHAGAHGLLTEHIYQVTEGTEASLNSEKNLFLDIHYFGPGKVSAKDVAAAHQKDLAVQHKYGVNLVNYWIDEKEGTVMCLAQAKDPASLIKTHKEAHGLLPAVVMKVKQGQ